MAPADRAPVVLRHSRIYILPTRRGFAVIGTLLLMLLTSLNYALSLGLANPQLFGAVVALSPGSILAPSHIDPRQQLFIAHGRSDRILSFANTSNAIVPELRRRGASVTFRPFAGDHEVDPKVLDEALDFALSLQAQPHAPTSNRK